MFKLQCVLLPVLWLTADVVCAVEPSFTVLPEHPEGGAPISALTFNGEVSVGSARSPVRPFLWSRDTGLVALSDTPGTATGISADGAVVVGWESGQAKAFRWTAARGTERLQPLRAFGRSVAQDVSADGGTVVGESEGYAVWWGPDGFANLLPGVPSISEATVSSRDGSIVAGTILNSGYEGRGAFRWSADEGLILLGRFPGHDISYAYDMTPDGRMIVGYSVSFGGPNPSRGFRWTPDEGMVALDFTPTGVSDDGGVMIGLAKGNPVVWTADSGVVELQPFLTGLGLDLTGWRINAVSAISGDGTTIAGYGFPPGESTYDQWIAVIPEPSTVVLAGLGVVGAVIVVLMRGAAQIRDRGRVSCGPLGLGTKQELPDSQGYVR
jgi:probable HAF family extracellular repeat protein